MKQIFIFLVVLLPFLAKSQTVIYGKYKYTDSLTFAKYKNNSTLDSVLSVDQNGRLRLAPASGLDTTSLSNRINARVKYTDTSSMLIPYLRKLDTTGKWLAVGYLPYLVKYTDTAAFLSAYYNKTVIDSKLALKLNISDTAAMLSPYARTANLPSLAPYVKYTDTSTMLSPYYRTANATAAIALKLNISDTANMLSSYYNKTATDSKLALKLNISDTANMLSPYARTLALGGYVPYTGATKDVNIGTKNYYGNAYFDGFTSVAASGTLITLTVSSTPSYLITGSGGQTIKLPDATTLPNGAVYVFNNNQTTGAISVNNNSNTLVKSVPSGGYLNLELIDNSTAAGSWDAHFQAPSNVSWSTNTFDYPGSITSATWNGNTIAINRGGTGASTSGGALTNLGAQPQLNGTGFVKASGTTISYDNSTYLTSADIAGKVNYTDTATMLSPYYKTFQATAALATKVNISDTSAMLSAYYNKTAVDAKQALNVKYTDTSSMLSGYYRSSNPSGYITSSAISGKVNYTDTSSMLSPYLRSLNASNTYLTQTTAASTYYLQTNPAGYITSSAITGKVNYTDTATMLSAYYNKTASDAKFNLKVNISDTASMLSGYKTYYPRAALSFTAGSGAYNNSTGVITIPTNTNQLTNGAGFISSYTETDPVVKAINGIVKSNGTTISAASAGTDYQAPISLTTTGSSGASTFSSNTLNVPNYTLSGLGGQPQLNGTGFVKASGTTISYDNSTYLTTTSAASTYLPLAGGTLTGALNATRFYSTFQNANNNSRNSFQSYNLNEATLTNGWIAADFGDNGTTSDRVVIGSGYGGNAILGAHSGALTLWANLLINPNSIVKTSIGSTINLGYTLGVGGTFYASGTGAFGGAISASNFSGSSSGTNTGDQTLSSLGAAADASVVHLSGTETITGAKTFSTDILSLGAYISKIGASNTIGAGSNYNWNNASVSANRQLALQMNGSNGLTLFYYDGASWSTGVMSFTNTGGATFGGNVSTPRFNNTFVNSVANSRNSFQSYNVNETTITNGWIAADFGDNGTTSDRVVIGSGYTNKAIIGAHTGDISAWSKLYINPHGENVSIGSTTDLGYGLGIGGTFGVASTATFSGAVNVGVATGNPTIHINGGASGSPTIKFSQNSVAKGYIYTTSGGLFKFNIDANDANGIAITSDNNLRVGLTTQYSDTRMVVRGSDATSSNYAFSVQNSTPNNLFYIRNDGLSVFVLPALSANTYVSNINFTDNSSNTGHLGIIRNSTSGNGAFLGGDGILELYTNMGTSTVKSLSISTSGVASFVSDIYSAGGIVTRIGASNSIGAGSNINWSSGGTTGMVMQLNASSGLDFWRYNSGWSNTGSSIYASGEFKSTGFYNAGGALGSNASNAKNHFTQFIAGNSGITTGWIAAAFGDALGNRTVIGQYSGYAVIAAHNGDLSNWSDLTITPTGNLHVGNLADDGSGAKLQVAGDIHATGNLVVSGTTFGGVTTQAYGYGHIYKGYTGSYYDVMFLNSGLAVDELQVSGGLNMVTTTAGFTVPNMTTTQKNALTKRKGMIVYDTTANLLQCWNGASWNNLW